MFRGSVIRAIEFEQVISSKWYSGKWVSRKCNSGLSVSGMWFRASEFRAYEFRASDIRASEFRAYDIIPIFTDNIFVFCQILCFSLYFISKICYIQLYINFLYYNNQSCRNVGLLPYIPSKLIQCNRQSSVTPSKIDWSE